MGRKVTTRIMVVDNSEDSGKTMVELTEDGFEVIAVRSAQDALAMMTEFFPDLIITESGSKTGMALEEFVSRVRRFKNIPVILLMEFALKEKLRAKDLGINDFVSKPYAREELFQAIQRVLAGR